MTTSRLTPYELLGADQRDTQRRIADAYKTALRAKTHTPQELAQAFHALRNPRKRLEIDLLTVMSEIDDPAIGSAATPAPPTQVEPLPAPVPLALRLEPGVIEIAGHRRDVPPLEGSFQMPAFDPPTAAEFPLPPFKT